MLSNMFKSTCIYPLFGSKEYVVSEWVVGKVVIIVVVGSVAYLKPRLCVSRVEYLNNCVYLSIFVPLCVAVVVVVFGIPLNLNNQQLSLLDSRLYICWVSNAVFAGVGWLVGTAVAASVFVACVCKQCNDRLSASQYSVQ